MHERLVTESMVTTVSAEEAVRVRRRRRSRVHSTLLLLAIAALLAYCGWIVADCQGALWSLAASGVMLVVLRRMPPGIFLKALNARAMTRWEAPTIYRIRDELCQTAGIELPPLLSRVRGQVPAAFTIGSGATAIIVLSQSLIETMSAREIRGILAHDIIHLRNGDLALMQLAAAVGRLTRVLSQIAFLLAFLGLMLRAVSVTAFPLPPLLVLAVAPLGVSLLQLALSREREAEADLEAAELTGDPYGLASALIKMRNQEQAILRRWYPGMIPLRMPSLLRDHPATEERIRRLLAMSPATDRGLDGAPGWRRRAGPWG
jgi:heat shock protein HtpX